MRSARRCRAFAARIESAIIDPAKPAIGGNIEEIVTALQAEASVEDEEGGVSLGAVASSLLARWIEKEHRAARMCEVEIGQTQRPQAAHVFTTKKVDARR